MSKGVHVAHNKLEASPQDQRGQGGHGAIPLSAGMLLVTLGVVYGDIGTSPMYTMKSIVANNGGIGTVSEDMILGALSLVIWTMTLVTTVKYVVIAMKADNHNEGGIFALFSLVRKVAPWLILPAMIGGAALLADGILTPAVTVTTAIEGLRTIEWGHALLGDGQTNVIIITIIMQMTYLPAGARRHRTNSSVQNLRKYLRSLSILTISSAPKVWWRVPMVPGCTLIWFRASMRSVRVSRITPDVSW